MSKRLLRRVACAWVLLAAAALAQDVVRVALEGPKAAVRAGETFELIVSFDIDEGFHIYGPLPQESATQSEVAFTAKDGFTASAPVYPPTESHDYPAMGGRYDVFEGRFQVKVPVAASPGVAVGEHELTVQVTYGACAADNCLDPVRGRALTIKVSVELGAPRGTENPPVANGGTPPPPTPAPPKGEVEEALEKGLLFMLLVGFLSGLAGTLTPCVYPVIPVTISYFGATGQGQQSMGQRVSRGLAYFLGIALFYGVLGIVAALLSLDVAPLLANPWVVAVLSAIFIALALSMFGLYELNLPPALLDRVGGRRQGLFGAFLLGSVMSLIAMPCVGPFVGNIFVLASTAGNRLVSFLGLLAFGVGLGFPFLFLSIFAGTIQALPRSGEWMNKLKLFFGFMMLGMVIYFVRIFLPEKWLLIACGALAVFWGTYTGAFTVITAESGAGAKFGKALGILILVGGLAFLGKGLLLDELKRLGSGGPAAEAAIHWETGLAEHLERAKKQGKPLIVDFTADN